MALSIEQTYKILEKHGYVGEEADDIYEEMALFFSETEAQVEKDIKEYEHMYEEVTNEDENIVKNLTDIEVLESIYWQLHTPIEERRHNKDFNKCVKRLGLYINRLKGK